MEKKSRLFFLLFILNFLFFMSVNTMNILPAYLESRGAAEGMIALFSSTPLLFMLILVATQLMRGRLFHKLRIIQLGYILTPLAMVGMMLFRSHLWVMYGFYSLTGVSYAAGFTNLFSMMYQSVPPREQRSKAALFGISGLMTSGIAALLGQWVFKKWAGESILLLPICFSLPAFFLSFLLKRAPIQMYEDRPFQWSRFTSRSGIYRLILQSLIFGGGFGVLKNFLALITLERLGEVDISRFFLIFTLIGIFYRLVFASMMDRVDRRVFLIGGFLLMAASLLGLNFVNKLYQLYILGALYGMAHSFIFPTLSADFVRTGGKNGASYNNIFLALFSFGVTAFSSILGYVAQIFSLAMVPPLMVGLILLTALTMLRAEKEASGQ